MTSTLFSTTSSVLRSSLFVSCRRLTLNFCASRRCPFRSSATGGGRDPPWAIFLVLIHAQDCTVLVFSLPTCLRSMQSFSPVPGQELKLLPRAGDLDCQLLLSTTLSLPAVSGAQSLVRILHRTLYSTPLQVPTGTAPEQFRTMGQRVRVPGQRDHLG